MLEQLERRLNFMVKFRSERYAYDVAVYRHSNVSRQKFYNISARCLMTSSNCLTATGGFVGVCRWLAFNREPKRSPRPQLIGFQLEIASRSCNQTDSGNDITEQIAGGSRTPPTRTRRLFTCPRFDGGIQRTRERVHVAEAALATSRKSSLR